MIEDLAISNNHSLSWKESPHLQQLNSISEQMNDIKSIFEHWWVKEPTSNHNLMNWYFNAAQINYSLLINDFGSSDITTWNEKEELACPKCRKGMEIYHTKLN